MTRIYRQKHPERTVLYRVLAHHFEEFLSLYERRFEKTYGYVRPVITKVVEKYLNCQTFGDRINLHPHAHLLVTEGGTDEEGIFHTVSCFDDPLIARFFCREVFSLLLREGLIGIDLVKKILSWRHTGFLSPF